MELETLNWREKVRITNEVVAYLINARKIRKGNGKVSINLPPVYENRSTADEDLTLIKEYVEAIVSLMLFWKSGACFYSSYAIACALRKRGIPLVVNLGCSAFETEKRPQAHCWLTLEGKLFSDGSDPRGTYNIKMGEPHKGIQYWVKGAERKT